MSGADGRAGTPARPRAVLLDALGTLLRLEPPAPRLRAALRDRCGLVVSGPAAEAAMRAEIAFYRAHLGEGRDRAHLARLRRRCAEVVRDALPAGAAAGVPLAGLQAALLDALVFRPYDDAAPMLRALRAAGLRCVVVSNWDVSLHEVLRHTGLGPLLHGVVTSAELGAAKPSPAPFRHALGMAGVPAAAAVHVGDRVEEDVEGALAAGVRPVLVRRAGEEARPAEVPEGVTVVDTLAAVVPLVV